MIIKKQLTNKQSEIKSHIFNLVREKIAEYRRTPAYVAELEFQISKIVEDYKDLDITVYIDSEDAHLLDTLKASFDVNIEIYNKEFLGGTRTIVPEKNILIDNSFKTRLVEEQENFSVTF